MQRHRIAQVETGRSSTRRHGFVRLALVWLLACATLGGLAFSHSAASSGQTTGAAVAKAAVRIKSIEEVRVGDYVLAKDPESVGPAVPHRVVALPRNWTEHLVHISVEGGGKELQATRAHPFWTRNRGWVDAKDLRAGDWLEDQIGQPVKVTRVWEQARTTGTFNLTVEGVHTFYVLAGNTPVLVHNAVQPWQFGNYNDLIAASETGDGLVIHHYPQGQPASEIFTGYEYPKGLAVAVPRDEHLLLNGTSYKAGQFTGGGTQLIDEAYYNMGATSIPAKQLNALDAEARARYLPKSCP